MLRELEPERYECGRLEFWLRHGWRRHASSYREFSRNPRLRHLGWLFDAAVERVTVLRPDLSASAAGGVVGYAICPPTARNSSGG